VLKQHPEITLMLTDHIMPGMDGFELTAKARSMFSMERLAIIGISAATEEDISINFLKCGANDYLSNPFSYQEFLCRIHQNLDMLDIVKANLEAAQCDFMTACITAAISLNWPARFIPMQGKITFAWQLQ